MLHVNLDHQHIYWSINTHTQGQSCVCLVYYEINRIVLQCLNKQPVCFLYLIIELFNCHRHPSATYLLCYTMKSFKASWVSHQQWTFSWSARTLSSALKPTPYLVTREWGTGAWFQISTGLCLWETSCKPSMSVKLVQSLIVKEVTLISTVAKACCRCRGEIILNYRETVFYHHPVCMLAFVLNVLFLIVRLISNSFEIFLNPYSNQAQGPTILFLMASGSSFDLTMVFTLTLTVRNTRINARDLKLLQNAA